VSVKNESSSRQGVDAAVSKLPLRRRRAVERILRESTSSKAPAVILARELRDKTTGEPTKAALCWVAAAMNLRRVGPAVLEAFSKARGRELAWETAKALVTLRPSGYVSAFENVLQTNGSALKAAAAAWALGASASKRASKTLLSTVQRHKVPAVVRAHACEALGLLGAASAVPTLRLCLRDNSAEVRFWAAYALGTLTATDALPELLRLAKSDRRRVRYHGTVAQEAKWAIDQIGHSGRSR
jgi:hypothetical protein